VPSSEFEVTPSLVFANVSPQFSRIRNLFCEPIFEVSLEIQYSSGDLMSSNAGPPEGDIELDHILG
jgi:hypothetical protein